MTFLLWQVILHFTVQLNLFDSSKDLHSWMYNSHNLHCSFLHLNIPFSGVVLIFGRDNIRNRFGVCFCAKTILVLPNTLFISSSLEVFEAFVCGVYNISTTVICKICCHVWYGLFIIFWVRCWTL